MVEQLAQVQQQLRDAQVELQEAKGKLVQVQESLAAKARQVEQLRTSCGAEGSHAGVHRHGGMAASDMLCCL